MSVGLWSGQERLRESASEGGGAPLFWDREIEESDLGNHRSWVLGRVLMFGTDAQVKAARSYFGDEAIRRTIGRREIDSRTRNYWKLILGETCTQKS